MLLLMVRLSVYGLCVFVLPNDGKHARLDALPQNGQSGKTESQSRERQRRGKKPKSAS